MSQPTDDYNTLYTQSKIVCCLQIVTFCDVHCTGNYYQSESSHLGSREEDLNASDVTNVA